MCMHVFMHSWPNIDAENHSNHSFALLIEIESLKLSSLVIKPRAPNRVIWLPSLIWGFHLYLLRLHLEGGQHIYPEIMSNLGTQTLVLRLMKQVLQTVISPYPALTFLKLSPCLSLLRQFSCNIVVHIIQLEYQGRVLRISVGQYLKQLYNSLANPMKVFCKMSPVIATISQHFLEY